MRETFDKLEITRSFRYDDYFINVLNKLMNNLNQSDK